jgi:hypothetical protein
MSADSSRVVFLSYASQDAVAARRICQALRAAGIEVWFDQNKLAGGDAWDAKIRAQIAALMGRPEPALRSAQRACAELPEAVDRLDGLAVRAGAAAVQGWVGNKELALEEYARLLRSGAAENVHIMKGDALYVPLWGEPAFQALRDDPRNHAPRF